MYHICIYIYIYTLFIVPLAVYLLNRIININHSLVRSIHLLNCIAKMSSALYKQNTNFTHSTGSFLKSAPVELTTVKGYNDFVSKLEKKNDKISTILREDKSQGYVLQDGEVIATIYGEAKDYLLSLGGMTE